MNRNQTYLGLIGYLFIGTGAVLIPSVMPSITAEFTAAGLTLATIGLIFPAGAAGGILGTLLAGMISDVIGRRRLVWLSALLLACALVLASSAQLWALFVIGFVLVSAAQGGLSAGINAMIADAQREARARALNTLHGVYGVGAAISPLIIGALIERGLAWRWALAGTGAIWLSYALAVSLLYRTEQHNPGGASIKKFDVGMLRQTPFLMLFLIAFIYNGVAVSLLGWVGVFIKQSAGASTLFSVSLISVFYIALTLGRFLCAGLSERIGYASTILILAIGITLTYPLVVLSSGPLLMAVGVFLTGLSLSGLFPTALAYGARHYPQQTGIVTGTLSVALTFGSMIPPLWTGVIAEASGLQIALGVNYLMVLPLIGIAIYLGRLETHRRLEPAAMDVTS
jgi:FHS family glucose/mannose:H+ symporter-like MFS transporter